MTDFQQVKGVERRRRILAHARANGRVAVGELACCLGVAVETVRRDLQVLEDDGLVRRTHGGPIRSSTTGSSRRSSSGWSTTLRKSNASQPQQWS